MSGMPDKCGAVCARCITYDMPGSNSKGLKAGMRESLPDAHPTLSESTGKIEPGTPHRIRTGSASFRAIWIDSRSGRLCLLGWRHADRRVRPRGRNEGQKPRPESETGTAAAAAPGRNHDKTSGEEPRQEGRRDRREDASSGGRQQRPERPEWSLAGSLGGSEWRPSPRCLRLRRQRCSRWTGRRRRPRVTSCWP